MPQALLVNIPFVWEWTFIFGCNTDVWDKRVAGKKHQDPLCDSWVKKGQQAECLDVST